MLELLTSPQAWASLLTLTVLEIVLGIDNIIFLSIASSRLPKHQQARARRIGLILALAGRLGLLFCLSWLAGLTRPWFTIFSMGISGRDIVLFAGGLFLIAKGTSEMHYMLEGAGADEDAPKIKASFSSVLVQIFLLDLVFSLDSILTAIGIADHIEIMVLAIVIAIGIMIFAAEPVSAFIEKHPTVKMLALAFLLLVGVALIADGLEFHIPRGYLYFAIAFSMFTETLNLVMYKKQQKKKKKG